MLALVNTNKIHIESFLEYYEDIKLEKKLGTNEDIYINVDILVMDDSTISINNLLENKINIKASRIFYYVSKEKVKNSTDRILKENGIILIPYIFTNKQIAEFIYNKVFDNQIDSKNNNIITFYGADHYVGTTMTSLCIAENIAANINGNVILVHLDGTLNKDYINVKVDRSLDYIKIKLIHKLVTFGEIKDIFIKVGDNLNLISGIDSIFYRDEYMPEHIEFLLNILSKHFDVVIVDAGTGINNQFSLGSISITNNNYLVVTQSDKVLRNYNNNYKEILTQLGLNDFMVVVNKYISDISFLDNAYQISDKYGHPFAANIYDSQFSLQAEHDRKSLLNFNDKKYKKSINDLSYKIMQELELIQNEKKRRFKLFGGKL